MGKIEDTIKDYHYANFTSLDEQWSVYCLEDKSIIKQKVVPLKIIKKDNDYAVNSTILTVTFSLRKGKPSKIPVPTTEPEILKVLDKDKIDMKFDVLKEPWNEYELDDGVKILMKTTAIAISGSTLYDDYGEPLYFVNHQILTKKHITKTQTTLSD
jgi:hypothetical protein